MSLYTASIHIYIRNEFVLYEIKYKRILPTRNHDTHINPFTKIKQLYEYESTYLFAMFE